MPYQKYPWHRFQYWLRQQPDHAIAGTRLDVEHNPIARFLRERTGKPFMVSLCYFTLPDDSSSIYRLPEWAEEFMDALYIDSDRERYTFVTARRIMRQVSEEMRYGNR